MIIDILLTIIPTFLILFTIFIVLKIVLKVKWSMVYKSLLAGIVTVIPALILIKFTGLFLTIILPIKIPFMAFQLLSAINEEFFKYISINRIINAKNKFVSAVFIGGGFSLCETLYVSFNDMPSAYARSVTTLPLHIFTSILLAKGSISKRYNLLAVLIHFSYNIILFNYPL